MSALLLPALAAGSSGQGAQYVDDVFSTYLRTGTGADTTVTAGIDMTKGYMLWSKGRSGATEHAVYDSARGVTLELVTNSTAAQTTKAAGLKAVSPTGYTIGSLAKMNTSGATYVDWVFRKAPKFFDIVTYTGNGVAGRQIAHSLGVAPGMIIVKDIGAANDWIVYNRGAGNNKFLTLNSIDAATPAADWGNTDPTATHFTVGSRAFNNGNGNTYVAYLFAHDPSAEGIVQCGSYTGNSSATGPVVTLGWEPQYLMIKNASGTGNWQIIDSMRGMPVGSADATLQANLSNAESATDYVSPAATGFQVTSTSSEVNTSGSTYIYLAIRRPNKPPTTGTQVYNAIARTGTGAAATVTGAGFAPDLSIYSARNGSHDNMFLDRLRGSPYLTPSNTQAETAPSNIYWDVMDGYRTDSNYGNYAGSDINHFFRRATGFMDVVCYTGTGSSQSVLHGLTVAPSLLIIKRRDSIANWVTGFGFGASVYNQALLNDPGAASIGVSYSSTFTAQPTASALLVGSGLSVNSATYVAYLFATLAGISKVGSYIGNGTSQTIDCGFSTGARFFLVKATSTTGSWWVYDSARGIVSAADPALQLNSTAAEITSADAVDPVSVGIIVNQEATCSINATGVSYIFLAIA